MIRQEQRNDRTDAVIRIIFAVIQAVIPEEVASAYLSITPCVFIGIVHFEQIFVRLFEKVHLMMLKRVNELFGYLVALLRSEAVVRGRPAFCRFVNVRYTENTIAAAVMTAAMRVQLTLLSENFLRAPAGFAIA